MQILSFGLFGAIIAQGMQLKIKQQIDNLIGGGLVALHLLPVRVLGKLLRLNHSLAKPPRNIIVIKMLGLGSLILAGDPILEGKLSLYLGMVPTMPFPQAIYNSAPFTQLAYKDIEHMS